MAFVVIIAGVWLFDAVGGGWFGYLLTGLLFLVALLFAGAGAITGTGVRRYRRMSSDREIEHLVRQYPDLDWIDYVRTRESAEQALREHAEAERRAAGDSGNGEPQ